MTLEEKQRAMRERNKRSVRCGRPTANDVEELDAWRIEIAQAHFFAVCLLKRGWTTTAIAEQVKADRNMRVDAVAIERWRENGYQL